MAGELTPLVLLPRYTTYAGKVDADTWFTTIGMDVTQYQSAIVNMWRGKIVGTSTGFTVKFEESTDQDSWSVCDGSPNGGGGSDPSENVEKQYTLALKKRWFRVKIQLGNTDNVASCWAVGFLEDRLR